MEKTYNDKFYLYIASSCWGIGILVLMWRFFLDNVNAYEGAIWVIAGLFACFIGEFSSARKTINEKPCNNSET